MRNAVWVSLLDEALYRRFLAQTHPALELDDERLGVPSFFAPLDVREPMRHGFARDLVEACVDLTPGLVAPPALFIGTPFERYDQTHLLEEISDPSQIVSRARSVAREHELAVVVLTNVSPSHPCIRTWLEAGFSVLPSFPDTVIDLDTHDFAEHLTKVPAHDRSGIRRNIRRFEAAGHRLERLEGSSRHADDLFAAYWPFFRNAAVHWQPHTRDYFAGLAALDDRVHLTVARSSLGEIIGFIVNFEDAGGFQAGRVGVHPAWHRKDSVYFRLLYHVIEEALDRESKDRSRQISLEPTGYRMKRHLGARRVPMVNLIVGVSPAWSLLLRRMSGFGRWLLAHLDDSHALEQEY